MTDDVIIIKSFKKNRRKKILHIICNIIIMGIGIFMAESFYLAHKYLVELIEKHHSESWLSDYGIVFVFAIGFILIIFVILPALEINWWSKLTNKRQIREFQDEKCSVAVDVVSSVRRVVTPASLFGMMGTFRDSDITAYFLPYMHAKCGQECFIITFPDGTKKCVLK